MLNLHPRIVRDFLRHVRNFNWDQEDGRLYVANTLLWEGTGRIVAPDGRVIEAPNSHTTEGINQMLDGTYRNTGNVATWYWAPFSQNATPTLSWTAANFNANATEVTSYEEGSRQAWAPMEAAARVMGTDTDTELTAGSSGTTVRGAGLMSTSTKGGTEGVLAFAFNYGQSLTYPAGDTIRIGYTLTLANL